MTILEMSLGGGVLIAVILTLRRALLYKVPKWTFLLLWAAALCRLMVPFAVPSPVSVYTGAAWAVEALRPAQTPEPPAETELPAIPLPKRPLPAPGTLRADDWQPPEPAVTAPVREPVSPFAALYLTGAALCALFFGAAYLWNLRRFWDAVPVEDPFIRRWQEEHPTVLPVRIKSCRGVSAPMAYGLVRPVILLPAGAGWFDGDRMTYVLTHEYVHIRRGDLLWKLLLTAALCVHWCNPLVWAMYFCANRDLELACDEAVVRILGLDVRKNYARTLLTAAESGFFPLCTTYTTKNHMEERIRAIMKIKKRSLAAVLTAVLLVAGVTAVFATSRAPDSQPQPPSHSREDLAVPSQGDGSAPENAPGGEALVWPLPQEYQEISYPFAGQRTDPFTGQVREHLAIDIAAPRGTAVYAAKSGVVVRSELDETYGNLVELSHSDGVSTLYAHLSERSVEAGQEVTQGETVGAVGATGKATGPVLHFGVLVDGSPVDPAEYFESISLAVPDASPAGDAAVPEPQEPSPQEPAQTSLENRWGVPDGEIPQWTEFTVDSFEDARELGKYLEAVHGLYPEDYVSGCVDGARYIVQITYAERTARERLPDGVYPVNSRGETYGTSLDYAVVGYEPDLVLVRATNGESGYALNRDLNFGGYPGEINNPSDAMAYMAWLEAQPDVILIPVYDVNRDNIVGYFGLSNSSGSITPEEELSMVEDQLRRNMGLSEEEIAKELEKLKEAKGWS